MSSKLDLIKDWNRPIRKAHYRADELPAVVNSSHRNLRRYFTQLFGRSPQEELDQRRGQRAKALLLKGCQEKAFVEELGFRSIPHFSAWFKHRFSLTPREFRSAAAAGIKIVNGAQSFARAAKRSTLKRS